MKYIIVFFTVFFFYESANGQKGKNEIQILPFVRANWFPEFSFNYGGRASTDNLKMSGLSMGVNFNYRHFLKKSIYLTGGLGYGKINFNNLKRENSVFGFSDSRPIEYPSTANFLYSTEKYHYSTVSLNVGVEKVCTLKNKAQLSAGLHLSNYFTFQQRYKINDEITYKRSDGGLFGQSVFLTAGIIKKLDKIKIVPQLILPVFDVWKKDEVFLESESERRSKWINGIGLGVQINYPLGK